MAVVLVAGLAAQTWAAGGEPNAPRPIRPSAGAAERPLMARPSMEDRLIPYDPALELERRFRRVQLTDEQNKKIQSIMQGKEAVLAAAKKAFSEAGTALNAATTKGDEAAIRAAAAKVGQSLADLQVVKTKLAAELKAVLTPEQLQKLEQLKNAAARGMQEVMRSPRPAGDAAARPSGPRPVQPQGQTAKPQTPSK
jgi:Spy/CpxP family protein refolding chaperone